MSRVGGCPCGRTGDNCEDFEDGVEIAMNETCFVAGFDECFVFEGEAFCVCDCGHEGDFCNELIEPMNINYLVGFGIALIATVVFTRKLIKDYKKKISFEKEGGLISEYNWPSEIFTASSFPVISPLAIFLFRLAMVILWIGVTINGLERAGLIIFFAFTYHNWTLFGLTFSLGTYLSFKKLRQNSNNSDSPNKKSSLETLYLILLEIALPSSLLIALVVWAILLPGAQSVGNEEEVLNFNSYVTHGGNTFLLTIEMIFMNKLIFVYSHSFYVLLWVCFYGTFHIILMGIRQFGDLDHCPVYGFLSMASPLLPLFFIGFMVVFLLFFNLCYYLMKYKGKKFGYTYQNKYVYGYNEEEVKAKEAFELE